MNKIKNTGYYYAIFSAILFGASTPIAKLLLGKIDPWLLAGLFYFGSGVGIAFILMVNHIFSNKKTNEAPLKKSDWKWLLAATISGGIIGPILLMSGLANAGAANVSLLLTLEAVFTAAIAWIIFKEHTDKKLIFGVILIISGSILLSFKSSNNSVSIKSFLLISGACFAWAIDNNLTRNISSANPLHIVAIKSTIAGITNIILAIAIGTVIPIHFSMIVISVFVGFIGYGLSLILFVLALRHIGTARTGTYFSLAPFIGAICAILFLHEPLTWQIMAAGLLMGAGLWFHITEYHEHEHEHESFIHDHKHTHDEHHQHEHSPDDPHGEPHSHRHTHAIVKHTHFHYPDIHHLHSHNTSPREIPKVVD